MNTVRAWARQIVARGVKPLLTEREFRRPGGGNRFVRERGHLRQIIICTAPAQGGAGELRVRAEQRYGHHRVWSTLARGFLVDPEHGDLEDVAIQVAAWLETDLLPRLEQPLDLIALARLYERQAATSSPEGLRHQSAQLWKLLGKPEEAARVRGEAEGDVPY